MFKSDDKVRGGVNTATDTMTAQNLNSFNPQQSSTRTKIVRRNSALCLKMETMIGMKKDIKTKSDLGRSVSEYSPVIGVL